jgi:hypothetical protein
MIRHRQIVTLLILSSYAAFAQWAFLKSAAKPFIEQLTKDRHWLCLTLDCVNETCNTIDHGWKKANYGYCKYGIA